MMLLRTIWKLLWLGRDYRKMAWLAIGTLSVNERHGGTLGDGVELTVWKFPETSPHGDAAAIIPVERPAPPSGTLTVTMDPTPTTTHWVDLRRDRGRDWRVNS